ncbi:MAG: TolC family protein, partial [Gammaproteobacteria bacterium]
ADALAARGTLGREMVAQQGVVEAARETYELSVKRFDHGVDSFLAVLDAQRELFGARSGLIDVRSAILGNAVELYRSLGGGWLDHTADAAPEGGVDAASLESRE